MNFCQNCCLMTDIKCNFFSHYDCDSHKVDGDDNDDDTDTNDNT